MVGLLLSAAALLAPVATAAVPEALPGAPAFPAALQGRLAAALAERGEGYVPRSKHLLESGAPRYTNRLLLETSPYLQQHAHNPVNWYPWSEEAFETARRLERPVFVSIGYSTCHWCHVMEEESFDDPRVARVMNEHFVAIKVDREVRPDIDAIYMAAAQVLNGSGGWPLNVWTTPSGEPFFAGTYFPPEDRRGRRGLLGVLSVIRERYAQDPAGVTRLAQRLAGAIRSDLEGRPPALMSVSDPAPLHAAFRAYAESFDPEAGGLRGGPKFPSQLPVRFLLRYYRRTGEPRALQMAAHSLERMAAGGIHDQLGGGFHRYATDPAWRVPHFEKMLYDNALRALEYLEAWQVTGRADFEAVLRATLGYVEREMTSAEGGFYSATDADSRAPSGELEEGRFFSWTPEEVDRALGPDEAAAARAYWGVAAAGPLEGRSVLHVSRAPAAVAAELGIDAAQLEERLVRARDGLLQARGRRAAPLRDEKVLTAWNGLMIAAFARAGFALDEQGWLDRATRAADFALGQLRRDGRLLRVSQGGRATGPAFLEDYAFLIAALLDLYEAAPDPRWLREAVALQAVLDEHYADEQGGGYFQTADDHQKLLVREKPISGGATPSGNAVAAANLLRLAEFTGYPGHAERADLLFAAFDRDLQQRPTGASALLLALDQRLEPGREIVLVRPAAEPGGIAELLAPLRRSFVPNRIVVRATEGADLEAHAALARVAAGKRAIAGRATAYVCQNRVCRFPTSDPKLFAEQLEAPAPLE